MKPQAENRLDTPTGTGESAYAHVQAIDAQSAAEQAFLYNAIVESSDDAIIAKKLDGTITAWNSAAERLYGYSASEAIGRTIALIVPEDRHPEIRTLLEQISSGQRVKHFETVRQHKDGRRLDVSVTISPVRSAEGAIVGASVIARDVADRKLGDARFRLVVEASPNGMLLVDGDGRIALANAETERLFGYTRAELIDQPIEMLVPPRFQAGHLNYRHTFIADPETRMMDAGRDLYGLRKDGSEFPLEIGLNPIQTSTGLHVLCAVVDSTARKRAEASLRESEQKLRVLFELLPVGVSILDAERKVVYANPALERIVGLSHDQIVSGAYRPRRYIRPDGTPMQNDEFASARAINEQSAIYDVETGIVKDDGSIVWIIANAVPVDLGDWQVVIVTTDITHRKQAERLLEAQTRELQRSNAELEQFAYIASHDLQEPLRMVASYTELLSERYAGRLDAKADKYIGYAVDGARRMQQLVNDLLAYSRVGMQSKPLQPTDSGVVLRHVLQAMRTAIAETHAQIVYDELPMVNADAGQLAQLFQNLLANAIKFRAATPPEIHISATLTNDYWTFAVADNGIGIDQEYRERIFQIFQRLHERDKYPGSGIGLSIAKRIVERHTGQIWFESRPGHGTTFFFTMPTHTAARRG